MEFILTFLLFIFIFGWVVARLFPVLLAWYLKRKMKNGGTSFGGFHNAGFGNMYNGTAADQQAEIKRSKEQEGKVTVTKLEEKEKVIEKDMGEYIEFEEEK